MATTKSSMQDLIDTTERLCGNFDEIIKNNYKLAADLTLELERYSWELHRTANNLRELKYIYGEV